MNPHGYKVEIIKNADKETIKDMLNNGWTLNNIVVLPYSDYHGIINEHTIIREFYFIRENIIDVNFFEAYPDNNINREL